MLSCERRRGTDHTVEELNTAVESLLQEFLQLQTEIRFFFFKLTEFRGNKIQALSSIKQKTSSNFYFKSTHSTLRPNFKVKFD